MLFFDDMSCADCDGNFRSASDLLQHFALHVNSAKAKSGKSLTKNVPDLYPIVALKNVINKCSCTNFDVMQKLIDEDNVNSGFQDLNLIKCFSVVVDGEVHPSLTCTKDLNSKWDLDYTLGKGTFKSQQWSLENDNYHKYDQDMIRSCQLQKQHNIYHCHTHKVKRISEKSKMQIPDLKPINTPKNQKSRKQDKMGIKRIVCHMNNNLQKDKF